MNDESKQIFSALQRYAERYVDARMQEAHHQVNTRNKQRSNELCLIARAIAAGRGVKGGALEYCDNHIRGEAPRVREVLRALVGAGNTANPAFAGNLVHYADLSDAFLQDSVDLCAFQAMFQDMRTLPLKSHVYAVTVHISAGRVNEGQGILLSDLGVEATTLDPIKVRVVIVVSDEVVFGGVPGSSAFFEAELRRAISTATDIEFVAVLENASAASHVSSGASAADIRADIESALSELELSAGSKIFVLIPNETFIRLSLRGDTAGADAFGSFPYVGSVRFLPCAGLEASSSGSHALVVDADGVFAGSDQLITFEASKDGALQMSDSLSQHSLTPTGSALTSLFQSNSLALKAGREIGCRVARRAVTRITGLTW